MSTIKTINVQHPSSSNANLALDNSGNVAMQAGTASAPAIYPTGDSNTGIYSPGANRLGFTTDGTQRGEFDASGNFQFNSGYGSVATAYGCRAWVNFNGTGTVAIRASGNVTSITDNGVADYTVNFTTAMPDTNYATVTASRTVTSATAVGFPSPVTVNVGSVRLLCSGEISSGGLNYVGANANSDHSIVCAAIFR